MKSNLEILLGEWGVWRARDNDGAQGFPRKAAFTVLHVDGMRGADGMQAVADADMRRVDDIIEACAPQWKSILIAEYLWDGPVKAKVPRLRLRHRQEYYELLRGAHIHVGFALGGKYIMPSEIPDYILSDTPHDLSDTSTIHPVGCREVSQ